MERPSRFDASEGPRIVGPRDGRSIDLGSVGVRFLVRGEESGGGFALVEHPIPPRSLAAPLHRHTREDEYSFVLEGRMGARLGDNVVYAEAADLAFKPRDQWHTFWNEGEVPCRILEIISSAGFERYFDDLDAAIDTFEELRSRYGTEVDGDGTRRICEKYDLRFPR